MKLNEVIKRLNLRVFSTGGQNLNNVEVESGYVSDLLSDVIAGVSKHDIWITIQRHVNILAVAKLKDVCAILISKGIEPDADTVKKAEEEGVIILGTELCTFEIAGKLYNLLRYGEVK
jgi:predicted transcriptional regulator